MNANNDIETQADKIKLAFKISLEKRLLKSIGEEMNAALITEDTSKVLEIAFPHSLDNSTLVRLNLISIIKSCSTPFGMKIPSEVIFQKSAVKIDKSYAFDVLGHPELNIIFSEFLPVNLNLLG